LTDIDPRRRDLVAAFCEQPQGPHSPELQRLVNALRFETNMTGKFVVVTTKPHAEWTLAQLPGTRNTAMIMHHDRVFTSLDDAERAIFKLRWESATGETLD
jgi:hypothetical protein